MNIIPPFPGVFLGMRENVHAKKQQKNQKPFHSVLSVNW
jgi:hypothetical protein